MDEWLRVMAGFADAFLNPHHDRIVQLCTDAENAENQPSSAKCSDGVAGRLLHSACRFEISGSDQRTTFLAIRNAYWPGPSSVNDRVYQMFTAFE
jgi:hypothetical protein